MRFKPSNISYDTKYKNLGLFKKEILINNFINLKKNNNDDDDDFNIKSDNDRKIARFIINVIYNIILYLYISYYIANHPL
jgi:hypothetical protein